MREAKRAYDALRGYIGREWDRISGVDELSAARELDDALREPSHASPQHEVRYEVTTRELEPEERPPHARRLLGVSESASFEDIRKAFERLNERSDPARFPEGSIEREKAAIIQRRVVWAYNVLTEDMNRTEKRFKSLELD